MAQRIKNRSGKEIDPITLAVDLAEYARRPASAPGPMLLDAADGLRELMLRAGAADVELAKLRVEIAARRVEAATAGVKASLAGGAAAQDCVAAAREQDLAWARAASAAGLDDMPPTGGAGAALAAARRCIDVTCVVCGKATRIAEGHLRVCTSHNFGELVEIITGLRAPPVPPPAQVTYRADPARVASGALQTGIYVRAKDGDRFDSVDLANLDKASVLAWLRSRGGENVWAENVVGILLGHGHLHDRSDA